MNILVIGKGGREAALIQALKNSQSVKNIFSFPGRKGFGVKNLIDYSFSQSSFTAKSLVPHIKKKEINLIIIGPEKELIAGWSDEFRSQGFLVFAPSQTASLLEGSKLLAKKFMTEFKIPTSLYFQVETTEEVKKNMKHFKPPFVLKADGLASGKGVFICKNEKELLKYSKKLFEEKILGDAGSKALLEEFQEGYELSVFALTNGKNFLLLPLTKDFKRRNENNEGPNTGGMGALAPINVSQQLLNDIKTQIIIPTINGLKNKKWDYLGVLYIGIIIITDNISKKEIPKVLEYNTRFGDPECQALLPMIEGDLSQHFYKIAQGHLPKIKFKNISTCCVVLSGKNYPFQNDNETLLGKDLSSPNDQAYFLHAGTQKTDEGFWKSDGGRILNVIGLGSDRKQACAQAYNLIEKYKHLPLYFRKDIK